MDIFTKNNIINIILMVSSYFLIKKGRNISAPLILSFDYLFDCIDYSLIVQVAYYAEHQQQPDYVSGRA